MKIKKILLITVLSLIVLLLLTTKSNASLYLNSLDFDAKVNADGTMDVTETWNINISDTNTLYKTFKKDSKKFSGITDVKVSEAGKGMLYESNNWAYHLQKDYYYGGINNSGEFEICWGVGLDSGEATRTYKISYRVLDAIAKYNDIAELYWQFVGSDFEISASKITGTIKLPSRVKSKDEIKVWGHVDTLNGEIYTTSEDTVEFNLTNFRSGRYVEVRVAFPTNLVEYSGRVYNEDKLSNIIEEETVWANKANAIRKRRQLMSKITAIGGVAAAVLFGGLFIKKIQKYRETLRNITKLHPTTEWEYFREIPTKTSTPAEALFLYNEGVNGSSYGFGNTFSATLLNLSLKDYIKINVDPNKSKKEQVEIGSLKGLEDLNHDEKIIAEFIKSAVGSNEKINMKELQKYIKNHATKVSKLIENTAKATKAKTKENGKYSETNAKEKDKYSGLSVAYFMFALMLIIVFPISIPLIINGILTAKIANKLNRLTQAGIDEREKWKGLKKYMEDFSLLNEKEVPAIEVWEEFLVYATVFGIADKVIKQLKLVYPEIENMENFNTASYVYLMSHTDFNSSFSSAINSSISSTMSSGSGGGGGFSGGGGGGRRPVAEAGGR